MAPVIKEVEQYSESFNSIVCATGQHREMSESALKLFNIQPDINLDLMLPNQSLSTLTGTLFNSLDNIIKELNPDWILAQGDTTTVLVSSMVAFYHNIRFGHVEAGLRTGNMRVPFPEEFNRRITDLVSSLLFAPTEKAKENLIKEGISESHIFVTGNTVVDALMEISNRDFDLKNSPLSNLPLEHEIILITAHRRESFGNPFRELCLAIRDIAQNYQDKHVHIVYPVHLNPNVRQPVFEILSGHPNISLIEPLDYISFVNLMKRSKLILTDSGGIQEESISFNIPVLVMRDSTERPEALETGLVQLVGTNRNAIVKKVGECLEIQTSAIDKNPFGDGTAAKKICAILNESTLKAG